MFTCIEMQLLTFEHLDRTKSLERNGKNHQYLLVSSMMSFHTHTSTRIHTYDLQTTSIQDKQSM